MEAIAQAHQYQVDTGNLSRTISDVQALIDLLRNTKDAVATNPDMAALHLAKLKTPLKQSFDHMEESLKEVNRGMNQYQKALKDKFKSATLPTAGNDALSAQSNLVNRAIAMHLLREGKFDVAKTFVKEVSQKLPAYDPKSDSQEAQSRSWLVDLADGDDVMYDDSKRVNERELEKSGMQKKFSEMYHILDALRNHHDLEPAIVWARENSTELENRGSNLEFELSRLRFVELFTSENHGFDGTFDGPVRALAYARSTFPSFGGRYTRELSNLLGSLAFSPNLNDSPYRPLFLSNISFEEVSASFTREFCGMLGLSSQSPLYTAVTAGGIALPVLEKVERIMAQTRGQWTSVNELPVETPLPPDFLFHSIFVCPVSKEQATDINPPMLLPCNHVIAKESLDMHSKGKQKMKCPYCPNECIPKEAKRVYI